MRSSFSHCYKYFSVIFLYYFLDYIGQSLREVSKISLTHIVLVFLKTEKKRKKRKFHNKRWIRREDGLEDIPV